MATCVKIEKMSYIQVISGFKGLSIVYQSATFDSYVSQVDTSATFGTGQGLNILKAFLVQTNLIRSLWLEQAKMAAILFKMTVTEKLEMLQRYLPERRLRCLLYEYFSTQ